MLNELIHDHQVITVYGKIEFPVPKEVAFKSIEEKGEAEASSMVSIVGTKINRRYFQYEEPVFILLPGSGSKTTDARWCNEGDVFEWEIPRSLITILFTPHVSRAAELLDTALGAEGATECSSEWKPLYFNTMFYQ